MLKLFYLHCFFSIIFCYDICRWPPYSTWCSEVDDNKVFGIPVIVCQIDLKIREYRNKEQCQTSCSNSKPIVLQCSTIELIYFPEYLNQILCKGQKYLIEVKSVNSDRLDINFNFYQAFSKYMIFEPQLKIYIDLPLKPIDIVVSPKFIQYCFQCQSLQIEINYDPLQITQTDDDLSSCMKYTFVEKTFHTQRDFSCSSHDGYLTCGKDYPCIGQRNKCYHVSQASIFCPVTHQLLSSDQFIWENKNLGKMNVGDQLFSVQVGKILKIILLTGHLNLQNNYFQFDEIIVNYGHCGSYQIEMTENNHRLNKFMNFVDFYYNNNISTQLPSTNCSKIENITDTDKISTVMSSTLTNGVVFIYDTITASSSYEDENEKQLAPSSNKTIEKTGTSELGQKTVYLTSWTIISILIILVLLFYLFNNSKEKKSTSTINPTNNSIYWT
ncbi:unnamed protein product [Didymodactylos carnosus]|uniref:Transmembrane protein n=1 Tax=Didymodactylos carnosus TaxID=1234261 RepID=A0A8S2H9Z8_9BILA|nr:unnamed protein product [Didymodactylos carnosus]CAF3611345.1 unnamed protein product [Didymodactylos carnosus]